MNRQKRILAILIALALCIIGGRYAWIEITSVSSKEDAASPDKRYTVKILSEWRNDFWGGTPHERHEVTIETSDGRRVRHVTSTEPWTGWPHDSLIVWAPDSLFVTLTFKKEEAETTRLSINVRE